MNKQDKVAKVMHEWKQGKLTSHGKVVKDYDQAIAIALSEAGLSKYAEGGEISDLGFAYLADLWFAVQQRDTDDYEKLSKRLDEEGVSYRIQNEVSADATELRSRKSLSISEVHDRIKKILSKKYDKGGWVLYDEDTEKLINVYETESEARKNLYEYEGNANIVEKSVWENDKYAEGGGIGFIPMDLHEELTHIAKFGGVKSEKDVIGILNAIVDSGLTDNDLKTKPTRTATQYELVLDKKTEEVWAKVKANYKGDLKGNQYFSSLYEIIKRNNSNDAKLIERYKPFRKLSKEEELMKRGGETGKFAYGQTEMLKAELKNNLRDLEMMNKVMLENDMPKSYVNDAMRLQVRNEDLVKELKNRGVKIEDMKYSKGGNIIERRYVNREQDYEVRYAKDKPTRKGYKDERKFAVGGEVGNDVTFSWFGDRMTGRIANKLPNGYEVSTDDGMKFVEPQEVINFSEPVAKKKRFGFFAEGGGVESALSILKKEVNEYSMNKYGEPIDEETFMVSGLKKDDEDVYFRFIVAETVSGKDIKLTPEQLFDVDREDKFAGGGEIQSKIDKLQAVVNSKILPESVKENARKKIAELEKELDESKETKAEEKAEHNFKVGSKIGFLRPNTGRYEYADVISIDGENVNLVVRHPKRSQLDNYFTETKSKISKGLDTNSEDWKDGRALIIIKKETKAEEKAEHKAGGSEYKSKIEKDLEKELHRLQRDLNSSRLQTYREGDNSEEEKARQRERASKLARFNEVLALLNKKEEKPKAVKKSEKVKLSKIKILWAEGDNSKYDKFPKQYSSWELANKAVIPVYNDTLGDEGYNKLKFEVTFKDGETYDGRLDVSEKEDNPTKTNNVIGKHIKEYLDYLSSEKSSSSEKEKEEIKEWLEKYDLGLDTKSEAKKPTTIKFGNITFTIDSAELENGGDVYGGHIDIYNRIIKGFPYNYKTAKEVEERMKSYIKGIKSATYHGSKGRESQKLPYLVIFNDGQAEIKEKFETAKEALNFHKVLDSVVNSNNPSKPTTRKAPVKKAVVNKKVAKKVVKAKFKVGDYVSMFEDEPALKVIEVYESYDMSARYDLKSDDGKIDRGNILETKLTKSSKPKADHKKLVAKLKAKKGDKEYDNRASINAKTGERYKRSESSDKKRDALPLGKRVSEDGNVYWENRLNRGDLSKKDKFEKGGEVDKNSSSWGLNLNW